MYDFNDLLDSFDMKDEFKQKIKVNYFILWDWRRNKEVINWREFHGLIKNSVYFDKRSKYIKVSSIGYFKSYIRTCNKYSKIKQTKATFSL